MRLDPAHAKADARAESVREPRESVGASLPESHIQAMMKV
jgi:hypothetical protein